MKGSREFTAMEGLFLEERMGFLVCMIGVGLFIVWVTWED